MEIDQSPAGLQPQPVPNPHHRKVELQSPLDLTYLRDNITTVARQKLDLHFPPDATTRTKAGEREGKEGAGHEGDEKEDPMRARVAALVNQYLDRTFDFASHSICINGNDVATSSSILPSTTGTSNTRTNLPAPSRETTAKSVNSTATTNIQSQEEVEREGIHFSYEAYDPRLSTKLASLYADLEKETLAVSQLRRTAPAEGARTSGEALLRSIKEDEERDNGESLFDRHESDLALRLDPVPDGWSEEVAEMYERGLADLRRLCGGVGAGATLPSGGETENAGAGRGGSLTETLGKVQRARDVAMELE